MFLVETNSNLIRYTRNSNMNELNYLPVTFAVFAAISIGYFVRWKGEKEITTVTRNLMFVVGLLWGIASIMQLCAWYNETIIFGIAAVLAGSVAFYRYGRERHPL